MNGNPEYNRRGGGIDERVKYGTIPIYAATREVNAEELDQVLARNGGPKLHDISDIPSSPLIYN